MKRNPRWLRGRTAGVALSIAGCVLAAGCTAAPADGPSGSPAASAPASSPAASSESGTPAEAPLAIAITISGGSVTPNGQKIDARIGQQVNLAVTSDTADEIHAHTGGEGYELEVPAGKTTTGSFTLDSAGSFEVESHHLEKVIVILNAR